MITLAESHQRIIQQTRSFDAATDTTFALRDKEEANDYRYFPEPDLSPFYLSEAFIEAIQNSMPALPNMLIEKYQKDFGLNEYDAAQLCLDKETAAYFESLAMHTTNYKAAANWINGPVKTIFKRTQK